MWNSPEKYYKVKFKDDIKLEVRVLNISKIQKY